MLGHGHAPLRPWTDRLFSEIDDELGDSRKKIKGGNCREGTEQSRAGVIRRWMDGWMDGWMEKKERKKDEEMGELSRLTLPIFEGEEQQKQTERRRRRQTERWT